MTSPSRTDYSVRDATLTARWAREHREAIRTELAAATVAADLADARLYRARLSAVMWKASARWSRRADVGRYDRLTLEALNLWSAVIRRCDATDRRIARLTKRADRAA